MHCMCNACTCTFVCCVCIYNAPYVMQMWIASWEASFHMHAVSAGSALVGRATCKYTFELTQMRNHMHVANAASVSVGVAM